MNRKTPEEYLKEHVILPEDAEKKGAFSSYELEFIKKYLGEEALPPSIEVEGKKLGGDVQNQDSDIDLRKLKEVQLVGFAIGEREIAIPIYHVQEVIKMVKYTTLPSSPSFIVGVINLRNSIVPLLDIYSMLGGEYWDIDKYKFIVVCNVRGFKIGILVERITSMHNVTQENLEWNIETQLGASGVVMGLIKKQDKLIGIMDLNILVKRILND